MNFYENYYYNYITASEAMRKASKKHWLKVHKENLKLGLSDSIAHSALMIAVIAEADEDLSNGVVFPVHMAM